MGKIMTKHQPKFGRQESQVRLFPTAWTVTKMHEPKIIRTSLRSNDLRLSERARSLGWILIVPTLQATRKHILAFSNKYLFYEKSRLVTNQYYTSIFYSSTIRLGVTGSHVIVVSLKI